MVDSRYVGKEGLRGYGKVCFIDFSRLESYTDREEDEELEELTFVEAVNLDCKEVIAEILASLPETVTEGNQDEEVASSTSKSGWEIVTGMAALVLFTVLKLLFFIYKSKRSSVI